MRAVPLIATSPMRHEEASPGAYALSALSDGPHEVVTPNTGQSTPGVGVVQQHPLLANGGASGQTGANGAQQQQQQPIEIQSYQPPWSSLIDYAHQQPTPDSIDTNSPRYQQLMSQVS